MCEINSLIQIQPFDALHIKELAKNEAFQILSISLEKGAVFPKHSSPTDAYLILLEGEISFAINENSYRLTAQQSLHFPKKTEHSVKAFENSKFLIVR